MLSPYKSLSNFATLQSNIFALFGRITFKLGKLSYSKALFPAVLIRDIRLLLFIKVVRNRGTIYYTNSRSRERKKNDIEKTAKQGSTTVSALIVFYSFCQNKLLRESSFMSFMFSCHGDISLRHRPQRSLSAILFRFKVQKQGRKVVSA